jgi:hypothetical protein
MSAPPPYPSIPYLDADPSRFLRRRCRVEEKLDGANVAIWLDGGAWRVMSRGGPDAMDRAGQLGRLRAWVAERDEQLRAGLDPTVALYAEWLWIEHGTPYDRLPSYLVLLDAWDLSKHAMVGPAERLRLAEQTGLPMPPLVDEAWLATSVEEARALIGPARWGSSVAEGVVLRFEGGDVCKVVRAGYERRSDESWERERRFNAVI